VRLTSQLGSGTRCLLGIPATISKEKALVLPIGEVLYAIPSRHVLEVVRVADHKIEDVAGGRILRFREVPLPLRSLTRTLSTIQDGVDEPWAVIVEVSGRRYAFTVPSLIGEFDLVRRPVDAILARFETIAASATLDDGRLVLLLLGGGLLRRADARAGIPLAAASSPQKRRRGRVLVVDDSPVIRDLITEMLAASGMEVVVAPEGGAALALLDGEQPDLILSDVEMPGMDGFELLRRIRARWQHLPVVMLTTRNSAADKQQAATLGADAYLVKSDFQEATLLDTVRRFVSA
jgi:CheY-like chemotaxis protein